MSCISTSEQVVAGAGLVFALVREPAHRALAAAGVVAPPDPVGRDARTVGFLRALDLDPVSILGGGVVEKADAWVPAPGGFIRWRPRAARALRPQPS